MIFGLKRCFVSILFALIVGVHPIIGICESDSEDAELSAHDGFISSFESEVGFDYSIMDMLGEHQSHLSEYIYQPEYCIETEAYCICVKEVLADNYQAHVNVEFHVKTPGTIVRPSSCLNNELSDYDVPVYFFDYGISVPNRNASGGQYSLGISSDENTMNLIATWNYLGTANRFRYDNDSIVLAFSVQIILYSNGTLTTEEINFELPCPALQALDSCYFESTNALFYAFREQNLDEPEFIIVHTPLDVYARTDAPRARANGKECGYWEVFTADGRDLLCAAYDLNSIPNNLWLVLYENDTMETVVGKWRLVREGNCLIPAKEQ